MAFARRPWSVAASILVLATALAARPAAACRCVSPSLVEGVRRADAVFLGHITAVTRTPLDPVQCTRHPSWCAYSYTYTVAVDRSWKGTPPATVTVAAGHGRGDCSYGAMRDTTPWLFMATGAGGSYQVRMCSGTQPASRKLIRNLDRRLSATSRRPPPTGP